jgi:cysteine desulfurase
LVTTAAEHSSVLGPARQLAREGYRLELAPVDRTGSVELDALAAAARRSRAVLVSVAAANNEVGTCIPLAEAASALAGIEPVPTLHTDAAQALGRIPVRLAESGVGMASFSAHKIGGPAGVGVLFVRLRTPMQPLTYGGEQESGLRPGTENVAAIVAASVAIELAVREQSARASHLARLSSAMWQELAATMPQLSLVGLPIDHPRRLPGTLSILARGVDSKVLVTRLDLAGLEVSAGSACASGSIEPSHVLLAMGFDADDARATLRVSLGASTVLADVREAVDILRTTLGRALANGAAGSPS